MLVGRPLCLLQDSVCNDVGVFANRVYHLHCTRHRRSVLLQGTGFFWMGTTIRACFFELWLIAPANNTHPTLRWAGVACSKLGFTSAVPVFVQLLFLAGEHWPKISTCCIHKAARIHCSQAAKGARKDCCFFNFCFNNTQHTHARHAPLNVGPGGRPPRLRVPAASQCWCGERGGHRHPFCWIVYSLM